jgi:segregation and condensation protein B
MQEILDNTSELDDSAQIEGILFISGNPLSAQQIASFLEKPIEDIQASIETLSERMRQGGGLRLQEEKGKYQITTAPELAAVIEKYLGLEIYSTLSQAALETLAIIAYKQPVTRPGIDEIRGVNSDGVLRTLLNKGLIEEAGRFETPGRPILYKTTNEFMQYFGLESLEMLPNVDLSGNEPENGILKD